MLPRSPLIALGPGLCGDAHTCERCNPRWPTTRSTAKVGTAEPWRLGWCAGRYAGADQECGKACSLCPSDHDHANAPFLLASPAWHLQDVSNVETMEGMFHTAAAFNIDIGSWKVSKVRMCGALRGLGFASASTVHGRLRVCHGGWGGTVGSRIRNM